MKKRVNFELEIEVLEKLKSLVKIYSLTNMTATLQMIITQDYNSKMMDVSRIEKKTNIKIIDKPRFDFGENIFFHPDLFSKDRNTGFGCVLVDISLINFKLDRVYRESEMTDFQKNVFLRRNLSDYPTIHNIKDKYPQELREIKNMYQNGIAFEDTEIKWEDLDL